MKSGIAVGDIMTRNFIAVTPSSNLRECATLMVKKRVGCILITEEDSDTLKGIITEKDILWAIVKTSSAALRDILVKDIMKRKVVTIKPSADVIDAVRLFRKKKVRRLPVIERGVLIGIVTTKDILRLDPGLFEMLSETFRIKEEMEKLERLHTTHAKKSGICESCGEYELLLRLGTSYFCESCYEKE